MNANSRERAIRDAAYFSGAADLLSACVSNMKNCPEQMQRDIADGCS
jgi:hypothetical protein